MVIRIRRWLQRPVTVTWKRTVHRTTKSFAEEWLIMETLFIQTLLLFRRLSKLRHYQATPELTKMPLSRENTNELRIKYAFFNAFIHWSPDIKRCWQMNTASHFTRQFSVRSVCVDTAVSKLHGTHESVTAATEYGAGPAICYPVDKASTDNNQSWWSLNSPAINIRLHLYMPALQIGSPLTALRWNKWSKSFIVFAIPDEQGIKEEGAVVCSYH